jgi:hypothetical protein
MQFNVQTQYGSDVLALVVSEKIPVGVKGTSNLAAGRLEFQSVRRKNPVEN